MIIYYLQWQEYLAQQHADQFDEDGERIDDVIINFPYSADMDDSSSEVVSLNTPLRHEAS